MSRRRPEGKHPPARGAPGPYGRCAGAGFPASRDMPRRATCGVAAPAGATSSGGSRWTRLSGRFLPLAWGALGRFGGGLGLLGGAHPLQPHRAVDDAEMAVRLGKIAARRSRDRVVSLGEQPEGRRERDQLFKLALCRIQPVHADQAVDVPEAAEQEGRTQIALVIAAVVAAHVGAIEQTLAQGLDRGAHSRVGGREEAEDRHLEHRRVQAVIVVRLGEGADARIPGARFDLGTQVGRGPLPLRHVSRMAGSLRQGDGAVQGHPAPQLAVGVVLALALKLPDSVVGLAAQLPNAIGEALDDGPEFGRDKAALALIDRHAVDHGAEDVQLALASGAVADPDRTGPVEARQMLEELFGQVRIAIDAVDDLHREIVVVGAVADPVDEVGGFLRETGAEEGRDAVGRVPQPAEAVVPVAIAPRIFGDRGGGRGAERAGRRVRKELDNQRRAANRLLERACVQALVQPTQPELPGAGGQLRRVAAARELPAKREVALAEAKREPLLATRLEDEAIDETRTTIHLFDAALHWRRGGEDDFLRATRGDHDALSLSEAGPGPAICGCRVDKALHLDRTAAGLDAAADPLEGKKALSLVETGHEIRQDQGPLGAVEAGGQEVRVADVGLFARRDGVDRRDAEAAPTLPVEDGRENRG